MSKPMSEQMQKLADRYEKATGKKFGARTNADRIRAMTDEELAKLLLDGCRGSQCDDQPQNEWGSVNCFECRMKWLQQPAENFGQKYCPDQKEGDY